MLFPKAQICPGLVAASLVTLSLGAAPTARAEEDTNVFNSMLGVVGMQFDKDEQGIDYRARAPLVLPPKMDLPKPVDKENRRTTAWPTDPDVVERRRKAADSHQPAPQPTLTARAELSPQELARGRSDVAASDGQSPSDCQATSGAPICLYTPWNALKNVFSGNSDTLVAGPPPPRKYLTEPPSAYRVPTKTVKLVNDAPKVVPDAADAGAYARASQQHKFSVDQ
jgi:hypothetical protein